MNKASVEVTKTSKLSLFDLTCVGVNNIVGSGIFLFPSVLAGALGPASVVCFVLVALLVASVALCFVEASSHTEEAGGTYQYIKQVFGEEAGFGVGWICWVTIVLAWAGISNGISTYLVYFVPAVGTTLGAKTAAVGFVFALAALNYRGLKLGAWTSNILTFAKLAPLILFIGVGVFFFDSSAFVPFAPSGWAPLGGACFTAWFAFQGFENIPVPSSEVKNPKRTAPLAILISLAIATTVYILIQLVAVAAFPGLAESKLPLAEAAMQFMGPVGAVILTLGAVFSMTGYQSGAALVAPRYLMALAHDAHFPPALAARHPRYKTPFRSIALTGAVTAVLAVALDFRQLVDVSMVVVAVQYILTCATVLKRQGLDGIPSTVLSRKACIAVPAIGILSTLWLASQASASEVLWAVAFVTSGYLLRALSRTLRQVQLPHNNANRIIGDKR